MTPPGWVLAAAIGGCCAMMIGCGHAPGGTSSPSVASGGAAHGASDGNRFLNNDPRGGIEIYWQIDGLAAGSNLMEGQKPTGHGYWHPTGRMWKDFIYGRTVRLCFPKADVSILRQEGEPVKRYKRGTHLVLRPKAKVVGGAYMIMTGKPGVEVYVADQYEKIEGG